MAMVKCCCDHEGSINYAYDYEGADFVFLWVSETSDGFFYKK